jgi:hypothetical protein
VRGTPRHHVRFTYYEERRNDSRVYYMLLFDGDRLSSDSPLPTSPWRCELSRCSSAQTATSATLRLLQWVTFSGSEEPIRLQPPSDRVPANKRDIVARHLSEYMLAWGAWRRGELSPPDYLEVQHFPSSTRLLVTWHSTTQRAPA